MNDNIKQELIKLRESLDNEGSVDEETLALAQSLEVDIQKLLDSKSAEISSTVDVAMSLETRFESEHPIAASIVREIINALHKMGV